MNWNSIVRTVTAFAMYIALVSAYFAGFSPLSFALFSALVLSLGLCVHSIELTTSTAVFGMRFSPFQTSGNPSVSSNNSTSTSTSTSTSANTSANSRAMALVPSLSESMTQLHSLQTEINELQAQFAKDAESRANPINPNGSAN